jgi:hypothetical protein
VQSVSDAFLATVAGSHQVSVEVDVLFNRAVVAEGLAVIDGSVTLDRAAQSLAQCEVTFAEPLLIPTATGGLLTPYGYELLIKRGVPGELVPLGVFPIQSSRLDGVSLLTEVSAIDRTQLVRDARFEDDYTVAAATNYATAIQALVAAGVADLEYLFSSTTHTTPQLVFEAQSDRWDAAQKMAASIGCELFFDGLGRLVLQVEPDLSTATPTLTVAEGDGGVLVAASIELDRAPAYNKWIHSSTNAANGDTFTGSAVDDDPGSPTYYSGPFGKKPKFFSSEFYASDAQCAAGAAADRARSVGVARGLEFAMVPNPAVTAGEVAVVQRAALGIDEVHVIDSLTIPLSPEGSMSCRSRARQDLAA